ncbi:hypothetical protein EIP91_001021 [Steccherinum ochraceum]|uniref:Protein kinase domain-containing protein n=1 Tax=Steccherinum ochraceum TaxID=92696 RepID=A0A4R0RSF7_9APHY|nr:hypothetical protein EIP91_001021 [Steccherinum ochraceum]
MASACCRAASVTHESFNSRQGKPNSPRWAKLYADRIVSKAVGWATEVAPLQYDLSVPLTVAQLQSENELLRKRIQDFKASIATVEAQCPPFQFADQISAVRSHLRELKSLLPSSSHEVDRLATSLEWGSMSEREVLRDMAEVIQRTLDDSGTGAVIHRGLRRLLASMTDTTGDLPATYSLQNIGRNPQPTGSGGFGEVYRGTWAGGQVAVKVLRRFNAHPEATDTYQRAFTRELVAWRQLRHPNIHPLLGVDQATAAPRLALVSPWSNRGNIRNVISQTSKPPILDLIKDVAAGIAYLHAENVVHGDLRGANILVNDDTRATLTDFGLAAFRSPKFTQSDTVDSRVRWAAPELLNGSIPRPTAKGDIFSFACVVVELYTTEAPYDHIIHNADVLRLVPLGEHPRRPTEPLEGTCIQDALWLLMEDCWHEASQDRPDSQQLLTRLQDIK